MPSDILSTLQVHLNIIYWVFVFSHIFQTGDIDSQFNLLVVNARTQIFTVAMKNYFYTEKNAVYNKGFITHYTMAKISDTDKKKRKV